MTGDEIEYSETTVSAFTTSASLAKVTTFAVPAPEAGMPLSKRRWDHLKDCIESIQGTGWQDLWLAASSACVGISASLAGAFFTTDKKQATAHAVLGISALLVAAIALVCFMGWRQSVGRRNDQAKAILTEMGIQELESLGDSG